LCLCVGDGQAAQVSGRELREAQVNEAEVVGLDGLGHDAGLANAGRPPDHGAEFEVVVNQAVEVKDEVGRFHGGAL